MSRKILASTRSREANRGLSLLVLMSLGIHGGLFYGAMAYSQIQNRVRPPPKDAIPVELVRLGKPRDKKLLPLKDKPSRQPPPKPASPKPKPKVDKPAPAPTKDTVAVKTKDAPKKPKKTKEEPKQKKTKERQKPRDPDYEPSSDFLKTIQQGEKLTRQEGHADGSPAGTTADRERAAKGYAAQVALIIQQNYSLPDVIPLNERASLEAVVHIQIDRNGNVIRHTFTKKHSNQAFMSALTRLLKEIKFPPPDKLARRSARKGITIRFKP